MRSACVPLSAGSARAVVSRPCRRRVAICSARAGGSEPFSESAAQVKRLVQRDRKEFLGNVVDILDKYETEFGTPEDVAEAASTPPAPAPTSSGASSSTSAPAIPAASTSRPAPAAVRTDFGAGAGVASPFASSALPRRSSIEPKGLFPAMSPDPITKPQAETKAWYQRITLTQVVLVSSFSTIIGLMIATFYVVVKSGAVRLAGLD